MGFDAEMVQLRLRLLMAIATPEGGVPWLLPSAHRYPRASNTVEDPPASLNPTAAIAGLLHKNGVQHAWVDYCWSKIADLQPVEMHEMGVVLTFLYYVPDRARAERELERLVGGMFSAGLVADADATGYVRKPLDWANTPDHPLRKYYRRGDCGKSRRLLRDNKQMAGGLLPGNRECLRTRMARLGDVGNIATLRANGRL